MSGDSGHSTAVTTSMAKTNNSYHKPCLKRERRLSDTLLPNLPKNDSLDDVSSSASCYSNYAGSLDSSLSDGDSGSICGSRKSVSFADSVGEDLCHVKVFSKELCEYDDEQVSDWQHLRSSEISANLCKGRCLFDVRTGRGDGGSKKREVR